MDVKNIGRRGFHFIFYGVYDLPTSVYVISGKKHVFIIDTFLGNRSMEELSLYMERNDRGFREKEKIIINSHYHFDHIWGNSFFRDGKIIAHKICRENIIKFGEGEIKEFKSMAQGDVILRLPDITFEKSISFEDEGIKIYHTIGHTKDSISVVDYYDRVLITGDNIEAPIPYLNYKDLYKYRETLKEYMKIDFTHLIAGHVEKADINLLKDNLRYIEDFIEGKFENYNKGEFKNIHEINLKEILG